jgi:hypothetical protein
MASCKEKANWGDALTKLANATDWIRAVAFPTVPTKTGDNGPRVTAVYVGTSLQEEFLRSKDIGEWNQLDAALKQLPMFKLHKWSPFGPVHCPPPGRPAIPPSVLTDSPEDDELNALATALETPP